MAVLLIVAGHETTVSLITNAVLALLGQPDELERLRADPSLMRNAVEELLRYDSPVERTIARWVTEDTQLGGQSIARGDLVIAVVGSANRLAVTAACLAVEGEGKPSKEFEQLHQLIKPAPSEARWAQVPWMPSTNIWAARQKAAQEGKPLFLGYMAGEPLGQC